MVAQAVTSAPVGPEAANLERIRQAVSRQPAITADERADETNTPVFRVTVREKPAAPLWDHWTNVPSYIRPTMPADHYDFMEMVTPEDFRAATLYPIGVPVIPLMELLAQRIRAAHRRAQEAHARDEVQQALAEVLACRADPTKSGC